MSEINDDVEVKVASEAAQQFVDNFYSTLNNPRGREHLTDFYLRPSDVNKVDLTLNGTVIADPTALQEIFTKQVQKCHYDVQAFDCHVISKNYTIGMPLGITGHATDGRKMSILVTVNGNVKYWGDDASQSEVRSFTDIVFLVPNWNNLGPKGDRRTKKWLIQSQTFRVVV